jgi:AraC family transcriptional regulator of adaptative response/methylated-DNA-[protein]-cysteine methyltransferase
LQKRRIQDLCAFITENLDRKIGLAELGRRVNLSPFHLQRLFKRMLGISPRQYAEAARLARVKIALKRGDPVRNAIYGSGRGSTSWLYSDPLSKLGMSPSTYKNRGKGMCIFYFTTQCSLGRLLIAGTDRGVCAVSLGDSDEGLTAFLMSEYPAARIERDRSGRLRSWTNAVSRYLEGNDVAPIQDLPLDIQATSFQFRVWKELQSIPYGSVCTYDEIADRISCPKGARAVANACANNKACLIIPCHRVVRKDGSPGGYRWGVERKTALLQHEKENLVRDAGASVADVIDSQPILRVIRRGTPVRPAPSRKAVV